MSRLFLDPAPPDELITRVGVVLNMWQMIEAQIESAIWGLAELSEDQGRALTAHMTFPLRCDVLRALYHAAFQNTDIDKVLNKMLENHLKPAYGRRNRYAHALWLKDEDGNTIFLEKESRGKPYVHPSPISVESIKSRPISSQC